MQKEIQNKKTGNKSGFSLIETIVAVFLITVGLIASVDLITKGLRGSIDSRDQLIAAELAQEGIELVRNIRDNNWVQGKLSFADFPIGDEEVCRMGLYSNSIFCGSPTPDNQDDVYRYQDGFYGINSTNLNSTKTKFQRRLIIKKSGNGREIYSVVTWGGSIGTFSSSIDIVNGCKTSNKCIYTKTMLSIWGENIIK